MRRIVAVCISILIGFSVYCQSVSTLFQPVADSVQLYLEQFAKGGDLKVTRVSAQNGLKITFNNSLSAYPFRDEQIDSVMAIVKRNMPSKYALYKANFRIATGSYYLEDLKSNYYTESVNERVINNHFNKAEKHHEKLASPLVKNVSSLSKPIKGLQNRHIALWQSHGYYYNQSEMRWMWQRARFFETIEDLYTQSYVLPFLVPMLENAGANVLLPRERDWNTNEVIVDNDKPDSGYFESGFWVDSNNGFADVKSEYHQGESPFLMGSARIAEREGSHSAAWIPDFPQDGEYGVCISYKSFKNSSSKVRYVVKHCGGITEFDINQKMGGGTWVYLGKFKFEKGRSLNQGVFMEVNTSEEHNVVSVDAVRFGGGMGNIARKPADVDEDGNPINSTINVEPTVSGLPRFAEAARYYLQWAGLPDSVYSSKKNLNDYDDDVASRGLWVNELSKGSYLNPNEKGYGIPIDLSLALHSDAGSYLNDSIVGTMAIYTKNNKGKAKFINGEDRVISRDYADIVQTQIVDDIKHLFTDNWTRRQLLDMTYSETRIPEVPAIIVELLSHQNFSDMVLGSDPLFKFTVSRAIYKGILKYLSYINDIPYVVQPLPVHSVKSEIGIAENKSYIASISWESTVDSLENTAIPNSYILYQRVDGKGWDNGISVFDNKIDVNIEPGHIYSYKVTAVNEGGESFPSEIVSLGVAGSDSKTALIVNNFDRISGPSSFATSDTLLAGFRDDIDRGVPYIQDISYVGAQVEFRRDKEWINDDNSGFGDSRNNFAATVIAGNTFDYPYVHGKALMNAGLSFCSISNESISQTDLNSYDVVDIICGKQITTKVGVDSSATLRYRVYSDDLQSAIRSYASSGGNIIISGSNIANDVWDQIYQFEKDSCYYANIIEPSKAFIKDVLKFDNIGHLSIEDGVVKSVNGIVGCENKTYNYNTGYNSVQYAVEMVDGLKPVGNNASTFLRYGENGVSAGVVYTGNDYKAVSLGFPIESLTSQEQIDSLMSEIMKIICVSN